MDMDASSLTMMLPTIMMFMNRSESSWISIMMMIVFILNQPLVKTMLPALKKYIFGDKVNRSVVLTQIHTRTKSDFDTDTSLYYNAVMELMIKVIIKEPTVPFEVIMDDPPSLLLLDESTSICIEGTLNIFARQEISEEVSKDLGRTVKTSKLIMTSSSGIRVIHEFLKRLQRDYDNNEEYDPDQQLMVFSGRLRDGELSFQGLPFTCTKNFDSMFFEEKADLVARVDAFQKECLDPTFGHRRRLGIPLTMGMLFHGQPGTGKTSVIKSIANHTRRHIVVVPMHLINNHEQLKSIFGPSIGRKHIPMNRRLYVFEEIDCSSWRNILKARNEDDDDWGTGPVTNMSPINLSSFSNNGGTDVDSFIKQQFMKTTQQLTLGNILDTIDGMVEMPGRIIIMTSNHPKLLDPALVRHGRIDCTIDFKPMSKNNVLDMYMHWFGKPLPHEFAQKLRDFKFTQAEIGNLFSSWNYDEIHAKLSSVSSHEIQSD
jgi:ATPase family associated with various cellular activities (AAA)